MKHSALLLAMVLAFAVTMLAQTTTTESGEHAQHKHGKMAAGGAGTLTGCLSGPNDEGAYLLTNARGKKVEVGGSDDLKAHVGHEVKLTGSWAKSGSEIGENEKNEKNEKNESAEKGEKGEHRHFKVAKIDHVADTCKQTSASAKTHHHGAGSDASKAPK